MPVEKQVPELGEAVADATAPSLSTRKKGEGQDSRRFRSRIPWPMVPDGRFGSTAVAP